MSALPFLQGGPVITPAQRSGRISLATCATLMSPKVTVSGREAEVSVEAEDSPAT